MSEKEAPVVELAAPITRFAVIYIKTVESKAPLLSAAGGHIYVCSTTPIKRGYGLKQVKTTPTGYRVAPELEQTQVEGIIDVRCHKSGAVSVPEAFLLGLFNSLEALKPELEGKGFLSIALVGADKRLFSLVENGLKYYVKHEFKNKQGQEVPYPALVQSVYDLIESIKAMGIEFSTVIDDSADSLGHVQALRNAETALTWGLKTYKFEDYWCASEASPPERYWNYQHSRDPFFNKSRMIFVTNTPTPSECDYHYLIDFDQVSKKKDETHKREIEIGQRLPTAALSVVKKVGVDKAIDDLVKEHTRYTPDNEQRMGVLFLKNMYAPATHKLINDTGGQFARPSGLVLNLLAPNHDALTHELYPPRQAFRLLTDFALLEQLLKAVLTAHDEGLMDRNPHVLDIAGYGDMTVQRVTQTFYNSTEDAKGKPTYKLAKAADIPNSKIALLTPYPDTKDKTKMQSINLAIGIDTPIRNAMSAMAGEDTEVYFCTAIVSERLISYQTVFVTSEGAGIFSGHYCKFVYAP